MITKIKHHDLFPLFLLILSFAVYSLLIPFLGFYWDDLPYLWFRHVSGVSGVIGAIALDRPLLAAFYSVPMSILGESPWVWQIASVLARWFFTWSMYAFLLALWPQRNNEMKVISLLVLVFPGFSQQWISVIYTHVFLVMGLYFYSLVLFVNNVRKRNHSALALIASILLSVICMTAVEYVAGLELLRPFIIYMLLADEKEIDIKKKIRQSLRIWLPYLVSFALFLVYRVFIASSVLYKFQQMDNIASNPLVTLFRMVTQQFKNAYASTIPVWALIFKPLANFDFSTIFSKAYIVLFILFFAGIFIVFPKLKPDQSQGKKWLIPLSIGAALSLLAAGLPFWAANLSPSVNFPSDRVLLPFMLGSSILLFVLIHILSVKPILFRVLFSLIFSLSAAFQLYQANLFRSDWENFTQFFQQLSWRIPSLEENTLLVTEELPLNYYSDNSLTAAFNWIYDTDLSEDDASMPYLINYTESRLGHSLASLEAGTGINHNYRIYGFKGSTDQMILFYHQPPGCVHIVDPDLDGDNPLLPAVLREFAANSRPELITETFNQNQVFFLSTETGSSWCYYYEKASLAAELGNWEAVVTLANTAFTLDDYPNDASERFPFIEGYARTGDWNRALLLSRDTAQVSSLYQPMLCNLWKKLDETTAASSAKSEAMSQVRTGIGCSLD